VRSFIGSRLGDHDIHDTVPIPDGAYGIPWRAPNLDLLSIDLPTEEYAEYLTNTLFFAMDPLYYLFDKHKFLIKLHQFFSDIASDLLPYRSLWHIQMLIVFAFGTSILARESSPQGPTGSSYFAKAIEALPDNHRLRHEPILAVEILCMVALFMQAMDMRRAAYDYVGITLPDLYELVRL
jgi:proline utilization trans-activator